MNWQDNKIEIGMVAMLVVLGLGLSHLAGVGPTVERQDEDIVYEMPRPKAQAFLGFDLSGRSISRLFKNPFAKKEVKKQLAPKLAPQAEDVARAQAAAQAKVAKKKSATKKKPTVDVDVVEATPESIKSGFDNQGGYAPAYSYTKPAAAVENQQAKKDEKKKSEDTEKLSPDQWMALVRAEPSADNITKLNQAFAEGQIDEVAYLKVLEDLLTSNSEEQQALALTAIEAVTSVKAFTLVFTYETRLLGANVAKATAYLNSYGLNQRHSALLAVMQTNDPTLVARATEILLAAKEQAGGSADPSYLSKFIAYYQQIVRGSDPELASIGQSALSALGQAVVASL